MPKRRNIVTWLFFSLLPVFTLCQSPALKLFTSADGLSSSDVNFVQSDNNNLIWVATSHGLNKYDGFKFVHFLASREEKPTQPSGNKVRQVFCDSLITWLFSEDGSLECYYNQISFYIRFKHIPGDSSSLIDDHVNVIHLSSDKKLFVGTSKGLSVYTKAKSAFDNYGIHPTTGAKPDITSFSEDVKGTIWIGTQNQGILLFNNNKLSAIDGLPEPLSQSRINVVFLNHQNLELWVGSSSGLWKANYHGNGKTSNWTRPYAALNEKYISCLTFDSYGKMWIGTEGSGLYWCVAKGNPVPIFNDREKFGAGSESVRCIYHDKYEGIWIATRKGLYNYHEALQRFPLHKTSILVGNDDLPVQPYGLIAWQGYLVAATDKGILVRDTLFNNTFSATVKDANGELIGFHKLKVIANRIFAISDRGIFEVTIKDGDARVAQPRALASIATTLDNPLMDIVAGSDSLILIVSASRNSLYRANLITGKIDSVTILKKVAASRADWIPLFLKRDNGKVLLWCNGSFFNVNQSSLIVRELTVDSKMFNKARPTAMIDDGTNIWIATENLGAFKCDYALRVTNYYSTENGLSDNSVESVLAAFNKIWFATKRGLTVLDKISGNLERYYAEQGLSSHEFNRSDAVFSTSKKIFFSTGQGIIEITPEAWTAVAKINLRTIVNGVMADNIDMTDYQVDILNELHTLVVDYGKTITLSFVNVNYFGQSQYGLQYRIDDQKVWLNAQSGSDIVFSKLAPGEHTLVIRGVILPLNLIGEPLSINIGVKPLFYQRWWFILLTGILSTLVIYALYRYRLKEITRVLEVRSRISRDLHDEVGATLSGLSMYAHLTQSKVRNNQIGEVEKLLDVMQKSAASMVNKLSDIVWVINPGHDSFRELIQRLEEYAMEVCAAKNIEVHCEISASLARFKPDMEARRNIYLLCKEAINNAVKYSNATVLELQAEENDKRILFFIKDNGKGFDTASIKKGNGLLNMKKRAQEIGAHLEIHSKPGTGTMVSLDTVLD